MPNKPTKEDRDAAEGIASAFMCEPDEPMYMPDVLAAASIIARRMAPERKRAKRIEKSLTDLYEWASNKAAEHDGPRENCCDFCWAILAAAEALDKSEER